MIAEGGEEGGGKREGGGTGVAERTEHCKSAVLNLSLSHTQQRLLVFRKSEKRRSKRKIVRRKWSRSVMFGL